jgi:hypothetical protein
MLIVNMFCSNLQERRDSYKTFVKKIEVRVSEMKIVEFALKD